jgi:formiminoglutamase
MKAHLSTPASSELFFKGRPGDTRLGDWVKVTDPAASVRSQKNSFAVCGYPDDLGVRLNLGRPGASQGPDSIRRHFYRMNVPGDWTQAEVLDWGNIEPTDSIMENHRRAEQLAKNCLEKGFTGIFLGGGHDFAAPSFLGSVAGSGPNHSWGLISVDPHLDVRPLENNLPHSGTAFRILLNSGKLKPGAFVEFGARTARNSSTHWQYCTDLGVHIDTWESMQNQTQRPSELFFDRLLKLKKQSAKLAVSFDMDACCETEGVSAPAVLGFSASDMVEMASRAGSLAEVQYLEISEVSPLLEANERSSRIAAEMIHAFVSARLRS